MDTQTILANVLSPAAMGMAVFVPGDAILFTLLCASPCTTVSSSGCGADRLPVDPHT